MPKQKTNSGAKKRFHLTATGKIKHRRAYKNHILTKKSTKRKRRLSQYGIVSAGDAPRIKALLGL